MYTTEYMRYQLIWTDLEERLTVISIVTQFVIQLQTPFLQQFSEILRFRTDLLYLHSDIFRHSAFGIGDHTRRYLQLAGKENVLFLERSSPFSPFPLVPFASKNFSR